MSTVITRFDPIYVQFGKLKQKFRPWRTVEDFGFIEGSPDTPLHLDDFGEAPDDGGLIVGLTVERLKREVKFGIPRSALAMRNGVVLAGDDLVVPGDEIEFVKRRKRRKTAAARPSPLVENQGGTTLPHAPQSEPQETPVAVNHDPTKFVVSQDDFSAHYQGKTCPLSRKPFALLDVLNRRLGSYVPLETLRRKIWFDDPLVHDKSIQKQVSILRTKLHKAGLVGVRIDGKKIPGRYMLTLK